MKRDIRPEDKGSAAIAFVFDIEIDALIGGAADGGIASRRRI